MSEREVLGCPFCGGPAGEESGPCGEEYVFIIACQTPTCTPMPCATSTIDLDAAITAWNRRSPSRQLILEEAAKVADHYSRFGWAMPGDVAQAIRSLSHPDKEKGDE